MPVKVRIPTPLRSLTGGKDSVAVAAKTVRDVIEALERSHQGIKGRLCEESGQIRGFVNFFVNDEDVRFLNNLETPVKDGDEISIIPAIAGGVIACGDY
ncbi:MAG: MoaD/ThiS family protein [Planctomycetales bacterium]|nr:MoaD/ThiS family protein [Planctomycetales bacterium]